MGRVITYRDLGFNGRLGNQLWQIASTIGIAESRGVEAIFDTDWKYRKYFNVPDRYFGEVPVDAIDAWELATSIHPAHRPYMQDLSLWSDVAMDVWDWFSPSWLAKTEFGILHGNLGTTAVHVRRTDAVVKSNLFKVPDMTYFGPAMEWVAPQTEEFFVFSDDMEWCKENFPNKVANVPVRFVTPMLPDPTRNHKGDPEGNHFEMGDFWFMRSCQNHVISNSTFSWWAAWLSRNPSPIVPKQWFNGRYVREIDLDHFLPPSWRRL